MGAVFVVPVARAASVADLPGRLVALVMRDGQELWRIAPEGPEETAKDRGTTLLIGAEREGLPREIIDAAEVIAHIPIATDSLNAAMAATVALYELSRMPPA
jgi:TrmH family RNA methyltransferase